RSLVLPRRERCLPGDIPQLPRLQRRAAQRAAAPARGDPDRRLLARRAAPADGRRGAGGTALPPAPRAGREQPVNERHPWPRYHGMPIAARPTGTLAPPPPR